jgi:hypothetical protein
LPFALKERHVFAFRSRLSRSIAIAFAVCAAGITAASAAGVHRFTVSQGSGSGGATNFLNANTSGGALEGNTGAADTGIALPFGVLGAYDNSSSSTFGVGVLGISTTGYAIAAESLANEPSIIAYPGGSGIGLESTSSASGAGDSIYSEAKGNGNGLTAIADNGGFGAEISAQSGNAVYATSVSGDAGAFVANTGTYGVGGGGEAILGTPSGAGVDAFGYSGTAATPALGAFASATGTDAFGTFNGPGANGNASLSSSLKTVAVTAKTLNRDGGALTGGADLQVSGDVFVYGKIFQNCGNYPATSSTYCDDVPLTSSTTTIASPSTHGDVAMYAARETLPSVEDYGTGHLAAGRAYVSLDPAFAATISRTQPYMVIVTPNGQSHGVYVSNRTTGGFEVHENDAGRDTVDFDYRIVARPLADASARLAAVPDRQKHGASAAAYVPVDRKALSHPSVRRAPAIDGAFARAAARFRSERPGVRTSN